MAVLEAEIPRLPRDAAFLTVTLRLPTATRPSDIGGAADHRLLALAVRDMAVFRVTSTLAPDLEHEAQWQREAAD